jgi:hypothetical protein
MTGKRSICTASGTKHLFEGIRGRSNLFHFSYPLCALPIKTVRRAERVVREVLSLVLYTV